MVEQYPHYLYVERCTGSTRLSNGDFQQGTVQWYFFSKCREETNGKGEEIQTADMKSYKFSSLIQMPKNQIKLPEGTRVIVANAQICDISNATIKGWKQDGTIRIIGTIAKYDIGQLHNRLWL